MRDRKRIGGRQRSLAFLSFFSYREIPLPAGKFKLHANQETKRLTKQRKVLLVPKFINDVGVYY